MRTLRLALLGLCGLAAIAIPVISHGEPATPSTRPTTAPAKVDLLERFVGGEWRIDGKWISGDPIKATERYEFGPGKRFVIVKTTISDPKVGDYLRYMTVFQKTPDETGKVDATEFVFDGSTKSLTFKVSGNMLGGVSAMDGPTGPVNIKQEVELIDDDHFAWRVWMGDEAKWEPLMDGIWQRHRD